MFPYVLVHITLQASASEVAAARGEDGALGVYLPEAAVGDLGRSASGRPVSPVPLNHYLQNMISPRSRAEYDEFNRFHFSQLRQLGRMDKREVTPKVRGYEACCLGGGEGVGGDMKETLCPPHLLDKPRFASQHVLSIAA
jgi:hypothetical protein